MSADPNSPAPKGALSWMAHHSVAANLLMALVLVGGAMSLLQVKQEVFPAFDLDVVAVTVPYPGAAPAEVEQGIVLAVEEAVRGVDGVKKVTSTSAEGVGTVAVELLLGARPDKALQDIKNEVDRIQTFPDDAEDPQVALLSAKQRVVSLIISGDQSLPTLFNLAERARAELLRAGGITQIEVEGVPPLEISVSVPRQTLRGYGLTLDDIANQLRLASLELPGGGIDSDKGEILVRVADRSVTGAEFADIIIRSTASGAKVRLGDIAQIDDGFEDTDQAAYFNGHKAVLLTAYRVGNESPSGVASVMKAYHTSLSKTLPAGVTATIWDDDSELLAQRIDLLVRNALNGIALVLLVLALFLDLRLAIWVGLGIPISFLGALFLFPVLGVSINMISLFALIITLGLVVDDAIVVGENIYEKTEGGMDPLQAAVEGASEMAMPVTFAILTTFAAFAPLMFIPGVTGKIFMVIPLVVLSVLSFSLLESFFVLPAHLGHGAIFHADPLTTRQTALPYAFGFLTSIAAWAIARAIPGLPPAELWVVLATFVGGLIVAGLAQAFVESATVWDVPHAWMRRVTSLVDMPRGVVSEWLRAFIEGPYARVLDLALTYRYAAFAAAVASFFVAAGLAGTGIVPFSFLPKTEGDIIKVSARMPYGAPIQNTKRVADQLDAAFQDAISEVEGESKVNGVLTLVGQGAAAGGPGGQVRPVGSHLLAMEVDLAPSHERTFSTSLLYDLWQSKVPKLAGVESLTFVKDVGPSGGSAVDVQLSHPDTAVLAQASQEITEALRDYPDLTSISNGYAAGKPQLDFVANDNARTLGLTAQDIARQIRSSFFGSEAIREQRGRNEIKVMVRLPEAQRGSEHDLDQLRVRTPRGAFVPLETVASYSREQSATQIKRESGQRVVDVVADLAPGVKSSRRVLEDLQQTTLPKLESKYPGLTTRFAGEQESQNESLGALKTNYLFGLVVIFALLAIPFSSYVQPLIIMSAIPFGFVGAIGGHVLMGYEISVISVMGIIALSGVVVNDSLVLIDAANGIATGEPSPRQAIRLAGMRRFRPILLTSLTTFFGLLPMIFETSVQARFLIPMAISLGFGVLFATLITLLIVPALYLIIEDFVNVWRWLYGDGDHPVGSAAK